MLRTMHDASFAPRAFSSSFEKNKRWVRPLFFTLSLTSLIDAFSILVIFLLMNGSGQKEIKINKGERLPTVRHFSPIENGFLVKLHKNRFVIENEVVTTTQIKNKLYQLKKRMAHSRGADSLYLIIQADQNAGFHLLSPVLQAAAHVGIENINFAVLPKRPGKLRTSR